VCRDSAARICPGVIPHGDKLSVVIPRRDIGVDEVTEGGLVEGTGNLKFINLLLISVFKKHILIVQFSYYKQT